MNKVRLVKAQEPSSPKQLSEQELVRANGAWGDGGCGWGGGCGDWGGCGDCGFGRRGVSATFATSTFANFTAFGGGGFGGGGFGGGF